MPTVYGSFYDEQLGVKTQRIHTQAGAQAGRGTAADKMDACLCVAGHCRNTNTLPSSTVIAVLGASQGARRVDVPESWTRCRAEVSLQDYVEESRCAELVSSRVS